jgi:hypothetical protein
MISPANAIAVLEALLRRDRRGEILEPEERDALYVAIGALTAGLTSPREPWGTPQLTEHRLPPPLASLQASLLDLRQTIDAMLLDLGDSDWHRERRPPDGHGA